MEVPPSLLVALMFVTLLSLGIGNVINTLSGIVEKGKKSGYTGAQIAWLILVLVTYFNMFWHTIDLLSIEKWKFGGFMYMMLGPILIYFATSLLIASSSNDEAYLSRLQQRFFFLFMLLQLWIVSVDLILSKGMLTDSLLNIMMAVIAGVLTLSVHKKVYYYGFVMTLILTAVAIVLRTLSLIR